jgi:hypothetical protein
MRRVAVLATTAVLVAASTALAQDDRTALARVRLTTDPRVPVGCTRIGIVRDDSIKDLRRKVLKAGGDTALLSFPADDLERIDAQVFRCPPHTSSPIPPPPPGPPPPPPPSGSPPPPPPPPSR